MLLRWAAWLAKLVAAGLIISFLSIWTTGYIVNSYVETLLKQFNLPLETKPFALSGMWGSLWGADPVIKQAKEHEVADSKTGSQSGDTTKPGSADSGEKNMADASKQGEPSERSEGSGVKTDGNTDGSTDKGTNTDANGKSVEGTDGNADTNGSNDSAGALTDIGGGKGTKAGSGKNDTGGENGGSREGSGNEALEKGMAMTPEEINAAKNQMSSEDKEKLFSVMMTKLPQEAWQQISSLIEDGLTEEEMTTVQQIVAQHLSREEYNQMMEILKKY